MTKLIFFLGALFSLSPLSSPPLALGLGIFLGLSFPNPFADLSKRAARLLLQICVVGLGFGMDLGLVLEAGKNGFLFAAGSILCTFALGAVLGKSLGVNKKISTLISSGTAICGGSAIAAVGAVIAAAEAEMSVAIGTIFLLNALALYFFPYLGNLLQLSEVQFATWAGVAIHDVSSVVGAASVFGGKAVEIATAVKLSRTLWIAPVAFAAGYFQRRSDRAAFEGSQASPVKVPWFILLFLLASLLRSLSPQIAEISPTLTKLSKVGLAFTLFLIGSGISRKTLASVGWQPLLQGIVLWIAISCGSLLVVLKTLP